MARSYDNSYRHGNTTARFRKRWAGVLIHAHPHFRRQLSGETVTVTQGAQTIPQAYSYEKRISSTSEAIAITSPAIS